MSVRARYSTLLLFTQRELSQSAVRKEVMTDTTGRRPTVCLLPYTVTVILSQVTLLAAIIPLLKSQTGNYRQEQPVTSGETRTGTVWDQRAINCPKCEIQDVTLAYISLKCLLATADLTQSQKIVQTIQERWSRPFGDTICFIQHFERVYRETFTVLRSVSSIVLHCLVAL